MPAATPSPQTIPASTTEVAFQAATTDGNNGDKMPAIVVESPNTSQPVELAYAPTYPRASLLHRTSLSAADTSNPAAVPTWVGAVDAAYSTGVSLVVKPLAGYGTPPTGNAYVMTATGTWDTITINSQSGGSGSDYTLTLAASAGHAHAVGDYLVLLASGGISTNTASSVPSGPVGGPGFDWVDFYAALTYGSATAQATVMPRLWNARVGQFFDTSATSLTIAAAGTQYTAIRVETHGAWVYAAVTQLSGTGAAITIDAVIG